MVVVDIVRVAGVVDSVTVHLSLPFSLSQLKDALMPDAGSKFKPQWLHFKSRCRRRRRRRR